MADRQAVAPWVTALARTMDTAFPVPGTQWRFGLDTLLGIVPVLGDTATALVGLAMLKEAKRLRAPRRLMSRMVWNLFVDWAAGLIPLADLILDTAVKGHTKNATLLEDWANSQPAS